jgi:hypothetical protein
VQEAEIDAVCAPVAIADVPEPGFTPRKRLHRFGVHIAESWIVVGGSTAALQ